MRNQWKFLVREAFRNLKTDSFLSVTTVITLGICGSVLSFLLIGLSLLAAADAKYSRQAAPLRAFVAPAFERPADLRLLEEKLADLEAFDSVVFVSKEDALREFRRDFGEEMTQYLEANPLPHSYRLYPSAVPRADTTGPAAAKPGPAAPISGARMRELREQVLAFKEIEEVTGNLAQLEWIDRWRAPLQAGSLILLALVAAALALVVHNAIKLSLYARRTLVENMKVCGASGFFILAPFALEALLLGICGGLIGALALAGQVRLGSLLLPSLPEWIPALRLSLYLVAGTAAIALLSSLRTVHAFLRRKPV